MSTDSSQPLSEPAFHETPVQPEHAPFKPGKWFGIIALLCGAKLCLFFFLIVLVLVSYLLGLLPEPLLNFWNTNAPVLGLLSPICVIAGIVFGILARNTEGRYYGYIGLVLSVLYGLTASSFIAYNILVPCC
jgi:uncharacterized RDD family membrane protein YckC